MLSANPIDLVRAQILLFGKGLNAAKMIIFVLDMVENIIGKGRNSDVLSSKVVESRILMVKDKPFPKRQTLNSSKLKKSADDNFEFEEYVRKLSKRAENIVGKEEIAGYEQFLLFPQCFQKTCTTDT